MPDGTAQSVTLDAVADGVFETQLAATATGVYRAHVTADGRSLRGTKFAREAIRTAGVWHGGDDPATAADPNAGARLLCDLLECLSGEAFADAMERWGVDADAARNCIERYCEGVDELGAVESVDREDEGGSRPRPGNVVGVENVTVADLLAGRNPGDVLEGRRDG
jgi:hypothetical protein